MKRGHTRRLALAVGVVAAIVVASSAAWIGSQRATASSGAVCHATGRRERDSPHRYDELHRLVQPVELHRGAGPERDGHGLPAARPVSTTRTRRATSSSATGRSRGRRRRTARRGRSSCARTDEVVGRQADDRRLTPRGRSTRRSSTRSGCDRRPGACAQPREARRRAELDDARPQLRRAGGECALRCSQESRSCRARLGAAREEGEGGGALKTYRPQDHLPMVTGGAYTVKQYEKKGTTASSRTRTSGGRSRTPTRSRSRTTRTPTR